MLIRRAEQIGRRRCAALAAVLGALAVVVLTGCTASSPPVISAKERMSIRTHFLDDQWNSIIGTQYPEAIRPAIVVGPTLTDRDQPAAIVACLAQSGITSIVEGSRVIFQAAGDITQLQLLVRTYVCQASNPSQSEVSGYFSSEQADALRRYYVNDVRPCLLGAGAPSSAPTAGIDHSTVREPGADAWNPYDTVWRSHYRTGTLRYLELRCPPVPTWSNLGG